MEIVNATCYMSKDLESLWEKVEETVTAATELAAKRGLYRPWTRTPPPTLRVGYYTPSETPAFSFNYEFKYTSLRGVGYSSSRDPRLGVVKKGGLPLSPLQALASATDEHTLVPAEVVREVAFRMATIIASTTVICSELRDVWDWVDGFKLRFRERARRGSRVAVRKAREENKLRVLRQQIRNCETEVRRSEEKVLEAKRALGRKRALLERRKQELERM